MSLPSEPPASDPMADAPAAPASGQRAVNLFKALVVNAVPLWGLARGGWEGSTLLCLYWGETVVGTLLNGVRILVHRRITQTRGHYRASAAGEPRRPNGFLREYLVISLLFNLFHGLFLAGLLALMARNHHLPLPDADTLRRGGLWLLAAMLLGLGVDLWRIRRQPFAWVRRLRDASVQRVFVIHVTIIVGAVLTAWTDRPAALFLVFAALKLLIDVISALATDRVSTTPPRWLAALMGRVAPRRDSGALWRRIVLDQRAAMAHDEEHQPPG